MPVVPAIAILACLYLMLNLSGETWLRFGIRMLLGFVVYFVYSRSHSTVGRREVEDERRSRATG